nr:immunoglobulin heavy chain junction region [Mus musculus]
CTRGVVATFDYW